MNQGALAILDCLGFKGIWQRSDPAVIIRKFQSIQKLVQDGLPASPVASIQAEESIQLRVSFLSDTIVLSVQYAEAAARASDHSGFLIERSVVAVANIIRLYLADDPPMPLRGCITYGEHLCEGNFLIGPAVDEAANHMNEAQGALVWLLPDAATKLRAFKEWQIQGVQTDDLSKLFPTDSQDAATFRSAVLGFLNAPVTIEYPMPIKSGGTLMVHVVNPIMGFPTLSTSKVLERFSKVPIGGSIDTWQKHENTKRFLEAAEESVKTHFTAYEDVKTKVGVLLPQIGASIKKKEPSLTNRKRRGPSEHS